MDNVFSDWQPLTDQAALDTVLKMTGYFHDSCLVRLCYESGACVREKDLAMMPLNASRALTITLQQQYAAHYETQLRFEGVRQCRLVPSTPDHDCIIQDAAFLLRDGLVWWADEGCFDPACPDSAGAWSSWVCAERCFWRSRPRRTIDL